MKKIYLIYPEQIGTINREIYGHFSEHIGGVFYDGLWVGRDSGVPNIRGFRKALVEKFKRINPPVLRWPGGCFAETYDWRDGIGENRPVRRNWWTVNDGRYESNEVGTHEFIDFCEMVGAEPYFAANITSTTPLEIQRWIDYCNSPRASTTLALEREKNGHPEPFNVKYWGIGNENWGGGGNMMPATYAHEYRKYAMVAKNASMDSQFIACGPDNASYEWTREFMEVFRSSARIMDGFSLHYYCGSAGDPLSFTKDEWYRMLIKASKMDEMIRRHWSIIQGYALEENAKLVIDEWGCWHPDGSGPSKGYNLFEQQSTIRDAMVAALTLNIFNNNCEKIRMANVAQLCNNLHCLFLAGGENFICTPTYHVFDMYKEHQGATAIRTVAQTGSILFEDGSMENLSVSASHKRGYTTITLANLSADEDITVSLEAVGQALCNDAQMTVLTHSDLHAHNSFDAPEMVMPVMKGTGIDNITLPRASVTALLIKHQ